MPLPASLQGRLKIPAIASPMFLASGPDLVVETCKGGMIGTFPALNQRTTEGYAAWLEEIASRLDGVEGAAPFGINLIVHRSNSRVEADLAKTVEHKVPLVITSLGAVKDVVDAVHSYGGLVFHDVINARHAEKAAAAGVDGIIAVACGAGGHAGTLNPFALISEIRSVWSGTLVLAGAINTGAQVLAARAMGADMAYLGTRFLATQEATIEPDFKNMIVESDASDILYTPAISGVNANFLKPSIIRAGLDPDNLPQAGKMNLEHEAKAWKTVWSAGQGAGGIHDILPAGDLVARLIREYDEAKRMIAG
ncbi:MULTISPECIES: nitronate monooxygenase family protein [Pannonibacter]|uniref:2-nitropropane dioxygenase n=1 Tax=Pannonibacter phragmitetus TaxID=121719 RepID=A0A0U3NHN8_9HYPH|nr:MULTISPECIES: nitronate monooxygenase family protein [Pannonibacter]ALV29184.1 2-nitropropane dioxygenase [Pannonibacter phragmitetus]MBA4204048.1 geranylgeranylglyceryl/heptaprenylglyceryl phosphate synthase [Polymorphum sp.]